MSDFKVDLTNCDIEPIHIPGQVQSHGFMIVVDEGGVIQFHSNNVSEFIPEIAANLLGRQLEYVETFIGQNYRADFLRQLIITGRSRGGFERINPVPIVISDVGFYLIISVSGNDYVLEFEPAVSDFDIDVQSMMGASIAEILTYSDMQLLLDNSAIQVKQIIEFDRVMVYRFAKDGHGIVAAEAKNDDLSPWLGLHYPASDIPKQARELYKLNLTRLITDVATTPAQIIKSADNTADLDMTHSQLRAVSPIHIQYLKNMGVASSFSISLKCKDELWGLIGYTTDVDPSSPI